jgi:hypothetical protein
MRPRAACDLVHGRGLPIQVNDQYCLRARRDQAIDLRRIERVGRRIHVAEHRSSTRGYKRRNRRHAGVRHGQHLIAGLDAECQ